MVKQLETDSFYIMAKTNRSTTPADITANYLPLSNKPLSIDYVTAGTGTNEYIYKISGFSNGQQKVQFRYKGSESFYNADISYVSKNYIYVSNLQDGQTYEFDSSVERKLNVAGEYIGFENIENAQVQINGTDSNSLSSNPFKLEVEKNSTVNKTTFNFTVTISQTYHWYTVRIKSCLLESQEIMLVTNVLSKKNLKFTSLIPTFLG